MGKEKSTYLEKKFFLIKKREKLQNMMKFMLAHGANPNAQDEDGNTALHIATTHPQADIRMDVVWNLFLKTDDTIRNNEGKTAYDIAKENPNFTDEEVLKIMKESCNA